MANYYPEPVAPLAEWFVEPNGYFDHVAYDAAMYEYQANYAAWYKEEGMLAAQVVEDKLRHRDERASARG